MNVGKYLNYIVSTLLWLFRYRFDMSFLTRLRALLLPATQISVFHFFKNKKKKKKNCKKTPVAHWLGDKMFCFTFPADILSKEYSFLMIRNRLDEMGCRPTLSIRLPVKRPLSWVPLCPSNHPPFCEACLECDVDSLVTCQGFFATLLAQLLPDPVWKKTAVSMPGKTAPVAW